MRQGWQRSIASDRCWERSLHLNAVRHPTLFLSLRDFHSDFSLRDLEAHAEFQAVDMA